MKRVILGLLLMLVSGCAETHGLTKDQLAAIKTIGVVSSIGDDMMTVDGLLGPALPLTITHEPITDLGLDAFVVDQMGDQLRPQYQVIQVNYNSGDFRTDKSKAPVGDILRAKTSLPVGAPESLDAYVVVTMDTDVLANSYRHVRGLFLYHRPTIAGGGCFAGAVYRITIVDGHSFKTLTSSTVHIGDWVSNLYWRGPDEKFSDIQWKLLQREFEDRLNASFRPVMKRFPLVL